MEYPNAVFKTAMDFPEQDVDIFGGEYENHHVHKHGAHESSASFSFSSSSSRSSSSSISSSSIDSDGGDTSSGSGSARSGGEQNGGEVENVNNLNINNYEDYNYNDSGFYEEEEKDLFGSDNEDYCKITAISPHPKLKKMQLSLDHTKQGQVWQETAQGSQNMTIEVVLPSHHSIAVNSNAATTGHAAAQKDLQ